MRQGFKLAALGLLMVGLFALLGLGLAPTLASSRGQGQSQSPSPSGALALQVQFDGTTAQFTLEELKALPAAELEYREHIYRGAPIRAVLALAGADIGKLEWVEPWGADGYHRRYDRLTSKRFTTILAYERDGEPLPEGEGPLRAVYPGGSPKMMVKQVVKLVAKLGTWRLTLVTVTDGQEREREFTLEELKGLPTREITAQGGTCPCERHTYRGVALLALLEHSEIDLQQAQSVAAVASDGTALELEPEELTEGEPLLAWERNGAALPEELGTVALVDEGGVRLRQLERIIVLLRVRGGGESR